MLKIVFLVAVIIICSQLVFRFRRIISRKRLQVFAVLICILVSCVYSTGKLFVVC